MTSRPRPLSLLAALAAAGALTALPAPALAAAPRLHGAAAARERARLMALVKRDPAVLHRRSFVKRASLVNFRLPVTVRLRTGADPATQNVNRATVDLGTSLGSREIDLAGTLPATILFHDSYDGGALGNVDVELTPFDESAPYGLTTTSVPLLWNDQTSAGIWSGMGTPSSGCGDFTGGSNVGVPFFATSPWAGAGYNATAGAPVFSPSGAAAYNSWLAGSGPLPPAATALDAFNPYVPQVPGVDGLDRLAVSKAPGDDAVGGNASPFPAGEQPGGFAQPPDVENTVLRTNSLHLQTLTPGTDVTWPPTDDDYVQGTENYVAGKSGGQANLFGNIPGKGFGIDVTVNLVTKINSIIRVVDPDRQLNVSGQSWPQASMACRQLWTGWVKNYLLGIRLAGNLKIAPAITSDGRLRIAKVDLASMSAYNNPLAACLAPYEPYAAPANGSDTGSVTAPTVPLDPTAKRSAPDVSCNDPGADPLVSDMGIAPLAPGQVADSNDAFFHGNGAQVSVAGRISVDQISADVLLGG